MHRTFHKEFNIFDVFNCKFAGMLLGMMRDRKWVGVFLQLKINTFFEGRALTRGSGLPSGLRFKGFGSLDCHVPFPSTPLGW